MALLPIRRRRTDFPARFWRSPAEFFSSQVEPFFSPWWESIEGETALLGNYPVDIREDDNKLYLDAEMPGFEKDDISVNLQDGILQISAERKPEEKEGATHLRERRYTRFYREFRLPTEVDESNVEAKFRNGVLYLEMNKSQEKAPRRIEIQ